ncbi:MAG: GNAT family N-acetyltransferase [Halobacteriales archaeon]
MECQLVGWPDDGVTLELDHERFAYAGKFVMSGTGKAVATAGGDLLAAAAFNRDRTDQEVWRLRTVTVRRDRRGEGIGPRLLDFAARRLLECGRAVRIAVNNPFAYEAAYKAGFGFTGERTGLAELVLERPDERDPAAYRAGLDVYREREELSAPERAFVAGRDGSMPPLVGPEP